ncbi:MAG: hypothetical protein IT445_12610 [Phycisphaeraceae bacterium]|nr:hypothetical protein [Phycisphaeraceae bacterium]
MNDELDKLLSRIEPQEPRKAWLDALEQQVRTHAVVRRPRRVTPWLAGGAAVAACAALAVLMLLPGPGPSFADVQLHMQQSVSLNYITRIEVGFGDNLLPISDTRTWIVRDTGTRCDINLMGKPMVQVWLPRNGPAMLVDHLHRAVMPIQLPDMLDPDVLLRFDPATLVHQISRFGGHIEPIPAHDAGDRIGFAIAATDLHLPADARIELWVDRATSLPARLTCRVPLRNGQAVLWTTEQFQWDAPVNSANLLLDLPVDYERTETLVVPPPSAEALVRTLGRFADLNADAFPSSEMPTWEALVKVLTIVVQPSTTWDMLPASMRGPDGQRQALGDAIAGGLFYLQVQEADKHPKYFGDRVRLGDDGVLMSWRQSDGSTCIVRGNLQMETTP